MLEVAGRAVESVLKAGVVQVNVDVLGRGFNVVVRSCKGRPVRCYLGAIPAGAAEVLMLVAIAVGDQTRKSKSSAQAAQRCNKTKTTCRAERSMSEFARSAVARARVAAWSARFQRGVTPVRATVKSSLIEHRKAMRPG